MVDKDGDPGSLPARGTTDPATSDASAFSDAAVPPASDFPASEGSSVTVGPLAGGDVPAVDVHPGAGADPCPAAEDAPTTEEAPSSSNPSTLNPLVLVGLSAVGDASATETSSTSADAPAVKEASSAPGPPVAASAPVVGTTPASLALTLRDLIAREWDRAIEALVACDDIELQRNPETEADYALKVGRQRDACLRSELAMLRARRMLRLARSAHAEGVPLGRDTLALVVADEFVAVMRQADARLARYMALIDMREHAVAATPEEVAESHALYRRFVAWLHPSLHPAVGELGSRLLAAARGAYADGDLDRLRILATQLPEGMPVPGLTELPDMREDPGSLATSARPDVPESSDAFDADLASLDLLAAEHNVLDALASVLEEHAAELGRAYPAKYRERLADPNWVAGQIYSMNARVERCDALALRYRRELRDLLSGAAG